MGNKIRTLILIGTHALAIGTGFVLGIYALPILTAPEGPSAELVRSEAEFATLKPQMVEIGPVRTFENFSVSIPDGIDPAQYRAAIIWCEAFGQFITAAEYQ